MKHPGFIAEHTGALIGTHIKLPYPSVGATEHAYTLGVLAEGAQRFPMPQLNQKF